MFLIRSLLLISLFFTVLLAKGEVSKIFAHKEKASTLTYTSYDEKEYQWGNGNNLIIDGFEYNGHKYNYVSDSPIVKVRRVNHSNSSGNPCDLFAEKNDGEYYLAPTFPDSNGSCDMAKVMAGRVINVGALDLFRNVGTTGKNIERVDFISPNGIIAPLNDSDLESAGHVVTEKSGNNYLQISAILSIDKDNNPTSYGSLVKIYKNSDSQSNIRYGITTIHLPDDINISSQNLGFYIDNKKATKMQGKPKYWLSSNEPLGMAFITLKDLGINAGQKYYGFSYFGRDVTTTNSTLTDVSTYPQNTGGDTADPYGGVASYFVDKELGYGTCYGMIDNGTSLYEMDLSSNNLFNERKISTKFVGEGTAYRATNNRLYVFQTYKDDSINAHGNFSSLYSIDLNSNSTPIVPYKEQDNIVSDEVEGAEFYYNLATKKEILYIITSKKEVKNTYSLHAFYANNWSQELSGYPKIINNYRLDSLAIDPDTGEGYGIDDAGKTTAPKVYKLNLLTGVATFLFEARDKFDAEGLAFAIDGKLYAEDEGGYSGLSRKIYRVDLEQKKFIKVRNLSGTKDIEGLSCNGVHHAPMAISISDIREKEGDSGFTDFNFTISLNQPAPKGGITFNYKTKDATAGDDDFSDNNDTLDIGTDENSSSNDTTNGDTNSWWDRVKSWMGDNFSKKSNPSYIEKYSNKNNSFQKDSDRDNQQSNSNENENSNNDTDTNSADYKKIEGKLTIKEGDTNATIHVQVIGDDEIEDDETFLVVVMPPSEFDSFIPIGTGTIINDDENISKKLLADYHFDECIWNGTSGEVKDSSGNGFNATAMFKEGGELATIKYKEKIINRSGKFTMSKKNFIEVDNLNDFNKTQFSTLMWIKVHENVDGWQTLLYKGTNNDSTNGLFRIRYNYNHGDDKLELDTTLLDGSEKSFYKYNIGLSDMAWHHLVVTYSNREYKIYLDKNLVATKKYTQDLIEPNSKLYIGGKDYISNMYIDEVKLFNSSLKANQIEDIFNNESNGKNWDATDREEVLCSDNMNPFVCNGTIYISDRTKSGTGEDSGKTWLHSLDQNSTPYKLDYIGDGYSSDDGGYNAIAYNVKDNFIYALYKTHLLKIDRDSKILDLGAVQGLSTQLYAGGFDRDGYYYVSGDGSADYKMYKIDISKRKVIEILNLKYNIEGGNEAVKFWDMSLDKSGEYFYAMLLDNSNEEDINDKFIKINKNSGVMTLIKDKPAGLSSAIDLLFSDKDGDVFVMEHNNGFYKIDGDNGDLYKLSSTDELTFYNDGANCIDGNISEPSTISIDSSVVDFEGDSGFKIFTFNISFSKPAPIDAGFWVKYSDGIDATPPKGIAYHNKSDNNDFAGENRFIEIPEGTTHYELNVTIYGDIEIEPDEEFYIDIYDSKNLAIKNGRGVGTILNDDNVRFNIERVGSDTIESTNIDQQREKESLYTQIAGKDFDYSIVIYDKNSSNFKEYPMGDITLKIELIDNNSSTQNSILYSYYKYLDKNSSRFNIINSHDLKVRATRDAIFKISYLESNNTLIRGDYSNGEAFENNSSVKITYSRDNFAIRPLSYIIKLKDSNSTFNTIYATNSNTQNSINLASGYRYKVVADAIKYGDENTTALYYFTSAKEINATLIFKNIDNKLKCKDESNIELSSNGKFNYKFSYGELQNAQLSHNNVGIYSFNLEDINWTYIDKFNSNQIGCVLGSSSNNPNDDPEEKGRIGCNFSSNNSEEIKDIEIAFQPYQFNLCNTTISNRPNNGKDYIYMGDLGSSLDMGLDISSDIVAEGKDGIKLTNFTKSCMAKDVNINLNYTITTQTLKNASTYNKLITTNGTEVQFKRVVSYNSNSFDINQTAKTHLDNNITITADNFLDSNNGKCSINILYNLNKHLSQTINPIKISFDELNASSSKSIAKVENRDKIPQKRQGSGVLNSVKTFYYSAVIPDKESYPDSFTSSASTPVGVYIYCNYNRTLCNDMIGDNGLNSSKTQMGWYLAYLHNSITDGTINPIQSDIISTHNTKLNMASITPNSMPNFNTGHKGRIDSLQTNYIGGSSLTNPIEVEIDINPSPWLLYYSNPHRDGNPSWHIKFRGDTDIGMTGIGKTGKVIEMKANNKTTNKMDW